MPDDKTLSAACELTRIVQRRTFEQHHPALSEQGEADFINSYEPSACPHCHSKNFKKDGKDRNGIQRYRCLQCARTFTPATGTIFDSRKLPIGEWATFLAKIMGYESENACAHDHGRSTSTPPYWLAKLFDVLAGCQDGAILDGDVWIDETFWPVDKAKRKSNPDGSAPRGLSRNKLCIAVGVDAHGHGYYALEGTGKTSTKRTWEAFGAHIAKGCELTHDKEASHNVLVAKLDLVSHAYDAKACSKLPDEENPLYMIDFECSLLKKFLRSHSGFKASDITGWLDLFWVIRTVGHDTQDRVAWVLDRAMRNPQTLRYRDFFSQRSR